MKGFSGFRLCNFAFEGAPGGCDGACQVGVARSLFAGKVAVAGANLDLVVAGHADVARGAATAAGVADDKAGVKEGLEHAGAQHLFKDLPRGRDDGGHDARGDVFSFGYFGDGGKVLEAAVGA